MASYINEVQLSSAKKVPLKAAKVKDLLVYFKEENKVFYETFFASNLQCKSIDDVDSLNGDEPEDTDVFLS